MEQCKYPDLEASSSAAMQRRKDKKPERILSGGVVRRQASSSGSPKVGSGQFLEYSQNYPDFPVNLSFPRLEGVSNASSKGNSSGRMRFYTKERIGRRGGYSFGTGSGRSIFAISRARRRRRRIAMAVAGPGLCLLKQQPIPKGIPCPPHPTL
jgi:hypothetical protein